MKLTKCTNNHFYDADKYDTCPHCGAQSRPPKVQTGQPVWRNTEDRETERLSGSALWDSVDLPAPAPQIPAPAAHTPAPVPAPTPAPPAVTVYTPAPAYADAPPERTPPARPDTPPPEPPPAPVHAGASPEAPHTPPPPPLHRAVSEAAPYELPPQAEQKTVAFYGLSESEPVVGWLVCVKGEYRGQSFNLKSGQNFIGRAVNMDVWLEKEISVSRNKHTVIVFEPKSGMFFVQPGESGGLTYLDGVLVLTPVQMNAYSKISVGGCELIFIPFCGEHFSWE
ncbi:MAG: FHA domain-containing protein [Oscillospiraceae bacterium]|jgi:hypothetical protein|nr:FHA domain-containing protein [Oscillospiraceae bacterium]